MAAGDAIGNIKVWKLSSALTESVGDAATATIDCTASWLSNSCPHCIPWDLQRTDELQLLADLAELPGD